MHRLMSSVDMDNLMLVDICLRSRLVLDLPFVHAIGTDRLIQGVYLVLQSDLVTMVKIKNLELEKIQLCG